MKINISVLILTASLIANMAFASVPSVLVSIKPLHSLVAGVMEGVGEPQLLVKGIATPHTYVLRPSEAKTLQNAEVIFWLGEALEKFLEKPLKSLAFHANTVPLLDSEKMELLEWESSESVPHDEHDHQYSFDPHIWLDPLNAKIIVSEVVLHLSRIDPGHAETYHSNGNNMQLRLQDLHSSLGRQLKPVIEKPYIVFHPAYSYLEQRYGLMRIGEFNTGTEFSPGAKKLQNLRKLISDSGVRCIFTEPQFTPKLVQVIASETSVRIAELDPLGADLIPGPDLYFTLMENLARSLRNCLQ